MYHVTALVNGFPAKTSTHGSFGWSSVWLLQAADRLVLVETGPPSYKTLLAKKFSEAGLNFSDITDVLITHAHWDHLGNAEVFDQAQFWLSSREYEWVTNGKGDLFVSRALFDAMPTSRISLVADEREIFPGVTAHLAPGHTPGHLIYEVRGRQSNYLFLGDAAKNLTELSEKQQDSALDHATSATSLHKIERLAQDLKAVVVPGHDAPCHVVDGQWKSLEAHQMTFEHFAAPQGPPILYEFTSRT